MAVAGDERAVRAGEVVDDGSNLLRGSGTPHRNALRHIVDLLLRQLVQDVRPTTAGAIELTQMPSRATSFASDLVSAMTPALLAE